MIRFISFIARDKDKEFLNVNCLGSPAMAVYYHIGEKVYQWQSLSLMGSAGAIELVIPDMDLLPQVLLLVNLGLSRNAIKEIIDGDTLDTI